MAKDESFLTRWSRRKREGERVADPAEPSPAETDAEPNSGADVQEAQAEPDDAITPEELERLPRIEEITGETDIRQFLRRGVPRALRNAALRQKWLTTPAIRNHMDCAVDYAWDWNTPGGVPGDGVISRESVARLVRAMTKPEVPAPVRPGKPAESESVEAAPLENLIADKGNTAEEVPAVAPERAAQKEVVDNRAQGPQTAETRPEEPSDADSGPRRHGSARPA